MDSQFSAGTSYAAKNRFRSGHMKALRILHLEDDADYSELVKSMLEKDGLRAEMLLATTGEQFEAALVRGGIDLILADYRLPNYDGLRALQAARDLVPEVPFLLVSGNMGEKVAIESLKSGATDYVLKLWPERLVPAVKRALKEAEERTRRRLAETELRRTENYFRTLSENALDVVAVLNREGRFVYASPSLESVLGYGPAEMCGKSAFDLIHGENLAVVRGEFERGLKSPGHPVRVLFRARHANGSWRFMETIGQNRLADPEIAGVVLNCRDVTDRIQAEQDLRESEKRFRDLFEGSPDAVFVEACDGQVLDVNPAACRLHGMTREQLLATNVRDLVPVQARERVANDFTALVQGKLNQIEGFSLPSDGHSIPVQVRANHIDYAGKPALLLHVRDVTTQRQLEEQLRQSQKMEAIGQLAGGVAHDFNNLLTIIHGHASLLLAGARLSGPAVRSAQQVVQAAERAAGLTRQLLAFSRRQVMQPRLLDLNQVVTNMARMLTRILGEDIALKLHYSPQPAWVQADAGMIEQVLLNLVVNSRDAMPKGGVLTIELAVVEAHADHAGPQQPPESRFIGLSVIDTGCGILPENMGRIFEPFFTTKEVGKGTGLGLATVYGIVQQHRGRIEVQSAPGKGSEFRVLLPCAAAAEEEALESSVSLAVPRGTETILVVEDEEPVRELLCCLLEDQGYRIIQAESGVKALEAWENCQGKVDLLLTDLVMPDRINGRELAEKLWTERPKLKVIFCSGYSADVVGKDFVLRAGLNYLQKPFQPQTLATMVRQCLDAVN
jgi:two-component system, cell cycle sensor histidine kinase and response regulator CckA